ncbi:MAG: flagellar basal body P-ring protein FlgI [Planctomycetota bacterium]
MPRIKRWVMTLGLWVGGVAVVSGCHSAGDPGPAPSAPPTATYTGPRYLYNTVGSLSQVVDNRPQVVAGYGLVVGLRGTGTNEVPQSLRQWLINEMSKRGVGQSRYKYLLDLSPEELLASPDTAVVQVIGIIPPGSVAGTKFDLMVQAADTSTTSLVGGRLWTTELAAGGANPEQLYLTPLAEGRGPIYLGPSDRDRVRPAAFELDADQRRALVVAGGTVIETRHFELALNQPSRARAAAMANRINERFPKDPSDRRATANALTPQVIRLNIPSRFADQPRRFLDLVNHTFLDRNPGFVEYQAPRLLDVLREDPAATPRVVLALKALGPNAARILRQYYTDPQPLAPGTAAPGTAAPGTVDRQETSGDSQGPAGPIPLHIRLAALEAGAFVGDERSSQFLLELAQHEDPSIRIRVAEALVHLPRSIYGTRALRNLLEDPIRSVQIAAYESLARNGNPLVETTVLRERTGEIKMLIDRLPVQSPLIYITQKRYPRIVIFNPRLGFEAPVTASIWDNQLMVRRTAPDQPGELFIQQRDPERGNRLVTNQHQFDPTAATLAYVLAHRPNFDAPQPGYDLTYGEVADALFQLARTGALDADVEVDRSLLTRLLDQTQREAPGPDRPETSPDAESDSAPDAEPVPETTPTADPSDTTPSVESETSASR